MQKTSRTVNIRIIATAFLALFVSMLQAEVRQESQQADNPETEQQIEDSISRSHQDSMLIENLMLQIQELKLNEILIHNEYSKKNSQEDSIKQARQRQQIDSLRNLTAGVPLVVEGDTLFYLYAKRGGVSPRQRVENTEEIILELGKKLTTRVDSLFLFDSEYATDIMSGERVIITLTEQDGLWHNMSRQELAEEYLPIISNKVHNLHAKYGLMVKVKSVGLSLLVIILQIVLIYFTNRLFKLVRGRIVKLVRTKLRPITFKDYEFLDAYKQGRVLMWGSNVVRLMVIAIQLLISVPILFSIFPETKDLAYTLFSYVWLPLKDIFLAIGRYIPKLFQILVIVFCFRYLNRGLKYVTKEIATGKLKITGFYDDWAYPTYYILRFLLYSFMFVMIWPLLPSADSDIFKGVSVFVGLVFSLGSTTVIGNLMAGMVLTYMRSFKIGDQIKMGDVVGSVMEKTPFVTRIRTPKNEVVTIPNSAVMSAQTINYSNSAEQFGIIIHTEISVGYEVEKEKVQALLIESALAAKGINIYPKPFVMITKLDDFYCTYQINAYTKEAKTLPRVYSNLYEQVIDKFHEAGIELLSPHFIAQRDGTEIMMPAKYKEDSEAKN